ncbi:MAG TPA: HAMP domain-containing sensor histidine kinase [Polyangiaceae bacterium]|nr:HAMP domain-containing sensor histidine kinase [Polyangiaceae bacterium]
MTDFAARRRQVPFLVLAPSLVVVVGVLAAFLMATLGTRELGMQSDEAAALRAKLLATTVAARLRATPEDDRAALVERAARRSGAELLLVEQDGDVIVDGTQSPLQRDHILRLLVDSDGETLTQLGRSRYYSAPVDAAEPLSLLAFVAAPEKPFAGYSLVASVALLATLLVGVAALVALSLARDVYSDVTFVERRIAEMAQESADPAGKPVPVRSVDQVGLLAASFNVLVDRFTAAEEAYRQDLTGAQDYDRERSAFLAALSHELRTPLNAILGFADVLLAEVDGPLTEDARESLSVIRSSGEHLRALIDDILDLSALESGELRLSSRPVDVYPIAQEVVREAGIAASAKGLSLELYGKPAIAYADARRVRQIIGNVVNNAIKFTSKGGVTVRVDPRDGGVSIAVADTGPGIASKDHEAIFREFFQTGESRRQRVGTGLGLAISRRLVQMHRGFIDLRSQLGRGSLFTIVLPSQAPPEAKPSDPPLPPPSKSRPRAEPVA